MSTTFDIAAAVANPRLRDTASIMVNVGELRKLVDLAEYGIEAYRSIGRGPEPEAQPAPRMERYAEYDGVAD